MGAADGCIRCIWGAEGNLKPLLPLLVLILYSFFGAFLFHLIEEPEELELRERRHKELKFLREQTAFALRGIYTDFDGVERDNRTIGTLKEFQHSLNVTECPLNATTKWNFLGATFYAATLYTSIGYGHLTPKTSSGKVITVIYALIGIPLALYTLIELGKLLAKICYFLWKCCFGKSRKSRRNKAKAEAQDLMNFPLWLIVIITILWVFGMAGLFLIWEKDWNYGDSLYFTLISFTTVGLGDFVPSQENYMLISGLFILIGLAIVSTLMAIIQSKIEALFEGAELAIDEQYEASQQDGDDFGIEMSNDPIQARRNIDRIIRHIPGGRLWYAFMPDKKRKALRKRYLKKANMCLKGTQTDDYLMRSLQLKKIWDLEDDTRSHDDVNSLVALCDFSLR